MADMTRTHSVLGKISGPIWHEADWADPGNSDADADVVNVECVEFANDEPNESSFRRYVIDVTTWEDMGCPDVVTVTIEPGDKLNG